MEVTFYGHACIGIKIGETHLLIDPFISENPLASDIDINQIKADYILITTAGQDHTWDVEKIAKRTKAQIISNFEIARYFFNLGIENSHPMDLGGTFNFPFGSVKMVVMEVLLVAS